MEVQSEGASRFLILYHGVKLAYHGEYDFAEWLLHSLHAVALQLAPWGSTEHPETTLPLHPAQAVSEYHTSAHSNEAQCFPT